MNWLQKAITFFGITATVNAWGIIPSFYPNGTLFSIATAQAGQDGEQRVRVKPQSREVQVSPSESVVPNQLTQSDSAPGMSRPLTDELDVSLLARTVANFIQAERYQTESEMQFSFEAQGFTGQFSVLVKTIAQSPQQFRTEISTPDGFAQPTYILVSDGDQVWIYNPELKQYAVMDYERFDQSNDSFLIGFSSMLFLEMSAPFRQAFADGVVTAEGVIDQLESVFQAEDDMPLQGNILNIDIF